MDVKPSGRLQFIIGQFFSGGVILYFLGKHGGGDRSKNVANTLGTIDEFKAYTIRATKNFEEEICKNAYPPFRSNAKVTETEYNITYIIKRSVIYYKYYNII